MTATQTRTVPVRPVRQKEDWRDFLELPSRIYADDPHWVAPLESEVREMLTEANPFWRHAERELFVAYAPDARPAGRIVATWDRLFNEIHGERAGFFGFFECLDDGATASALLDAARRWIERRGARRLMGPFNPSINDECGLLVEGFDRDPYILQSYNPSYYGRLLEGWGLCKAKDLLAWEMEDTWREQERITRLADRARRNPALRVRTIDMRRFNEELALIRDIFNSSWQDNWGFTPLTPEEMAFTARKLKPILQPEMVHFAELDGRPAAMSIGLRDVNQALKPLRGRMGPLGLLRFLWGLRKIDQGRLLALGVRKEFRNRGLEAVLYDEAIRAGRRLGWKRGEMGWTLEDNHNINEGMRALGGRVYKTYRVFERAWEEPPS